VGEKEPPDVEVWGGASWKTRAWDEFFCWKSGTLWRKERGPWLPIKKRNGKEGRGPGGGALRSKGEKGTPQGRAGSQGS